MTPLMAERLREIFEGITISEALLAQGDAWARSAHVEHPTEDTYLIATDAGVVEIGDWANCSCGDDDGDAPCAHRIALIMYQAGEALTAPAPEEGGMETETHETPTPPEGCPTAGGAPSGPLLLARTLEAILADLALPLPDSVVARRQQGGATIRYLHWYTIVDVLNAYAPGWASTIVNTRMHGQQAQVQLALEIPHRDGVQRYESLGTEDERVNAKTGEVHDGYGSPLERAERAAFRRAAAMAGVGLWLYKADDTSAALQQHLRDRQRALLAEIGTRLDARQIPRAPWILAVRHAHGVARNDQITLGALQSALALLEEVNG